MHLDRPLPPDGCDVVEVLPDPVVADICPAADRQDRQELDLRVATRQRGVDVVARLRPRSRERVFVSGATRDEFSAEAQSKSLMAHDQRLEGSGCD
jgi:hypothetical protein